MSSTRPYLLRALYEWIVDNDLTPHLIVDAVRPDVDVPQQFAQDGRIVLNIGPSATQGLELGNDWVAFSARFGGAPRQVGFPPTAVLAIYARENGRGMAFGEEPEGEGEPPPDDTPPESGPKLRVVK
jgi:stringent starvation protein B